MSRRGCCCPGFPQAPRFASSAWSLAAPDSGESRLLPPGRPRAAARPALTSGVLERGIFMARRDSGFSPRCLSEGSNLGFDLKFSHWELRCRRKTATGARHSEGPVLHLASNPSWGLPLFWKNVMVKEAKVVTRPGCSPTSLANLCCKGPCGEPLGRLGRSVCLGHTSLGSVCLEGAGMQLRD